MTHSSLPQSLPAPLQSLLRDPTAIAILASIGVHGLLWAVLPHLPSLQPRPTEAEIQRQVGLVELSPEELARVPQSASQSSLPIPAAPLPPAPTGRQPQQFSLRPLPSAPPPSLPSILPPSFYIPPPPRLPLYIPATAIRPRSTIPTRPLPRPTTTPTPTPSPPQASPTPTTTPSPPQASSPTPTLAPGQDPLPRVPEPNETPNQSPTPNGNGAIAQNPGTPTPGSGGSTLPSTPASPSGDRPSPTPSAPPAPQYNYNSAGTSIAEGRTAREQWLSSLGRSATSAPRIVPLTQPLPSAAVEQLPESIRDDIRNGDNPLLVSFGVVVGADNRIVGEPQILQKSGFPALDEQIKQRITNSDFRNETGREQVYEVYITLQPEGSATSP